MDMATHTWASEAMTGNETKARFSLVGTRVRQLEAGSSGVNGGVGYRAER